MSPPCGFEATLSPSTTPIALRSRASRPIPSGEANPCLLREFGAYGPLCGLGAQSKPVDRSKFMTMREVLARLGPPWTEIMVRKRIANRTIPAQKIRGRNWFFPRAATEVVIHRLRSAEQHTSKSAIAPGDADALALQLIREGQSDPAIVAELRLTLDHVRDLRGTLDGPRKPGRPRAVVQDEPKSDPAFWDRYIAESKKRAQGDD